MSNRAQLHVTPERALLDTPLDIYIDGLVPGQKITVRARMSSGRDVVWTSSAVYEVDSTGRIDLNRQPPLSGTFKAADAMGLIWSMSPEGQTHANYAYTYPDDFSSLNVTFEVLIDNEVVARKQAERLLQSDGVRREIVQVDDLIGVLFLPPGDGPHPVIMAVSGSGGAWNEDVPMLFASHGYAALAVAYFNLGPLPKFLVNIPLEYFEIAINYLQNREDIDVERLAITGESRGGELALLLASIYPQFKVVIADVPSGILWGGFGYDPVGGTKPAWLYGGRPIPYMGMNEAYQSHANPADELRGQNEAVSTAPGFLETIRRNPEAAEKAEIPVENINGAVMPISGQDDHVWPSTQLASVVIERLKKHNFDKPFVHISYPGAGHSFSPPYLPTTGLANWHPINGALYSSGGQPEATYQAHVDSWQKKLDFLEAHL